MTRREGVDRVLGPSPRPAGSSLHYPLAIAGVAVLGISLAYQGLTSWPSTRTPSPVGLNEMADGVPPTTSAKASKGGKRSTVVAKPGEEGPRASFALELEFDDGLEGDWEAKPNLPARHEDPLLSDPSHAVDLIAELAQIKPPGEIFLENGTDEISRIIAELKQMGEAALPAIREFLESGGDVRFAELSADKWLNYATLRIALLDTLNEIPGPDALELMARVIQVTNDPMEIAVLAEGLDQRAGDTYRAEIVVSARKALGEALRGQPAAFRDIGHLFSVIQDHGDASVVADLEAVYQKGSGWVNFSLMALSELPQGHGIPSLIRIANGLADGGAPLHDRYNIALRMLAQASREYPEAGNALLQMAESGQTGTPALVELASTLGGREFHLVMQSSGLAASTTAISQLASNAPETWSDDEIDARIALIDGLVSTDPEPTAVTALEEAQRGLQDWRSRPMVNGKRVRS